MKSFEDFALMDNVPAEKLENVNVDELGNTQLVRILHMGNDNENCASGLQDNSMTTVEPPGQNMKSSASTLKCKNHNNKTPKITKSLATTKVIQKPY